MRDTVWVLIETPYYEEFEVIAVFSTKRLAQNKIPKEYVWNEDKTFAQPKGDAGRIFPTYEIWKCSVNPKTIRPPQRKR